MLQRIPNKACEAILSIELASLMRKQNRGKKTNNDDDKRMAKCLKAAKPYTKYCFRDMTEAKVFFEKFKEQRER